MPKYLIQASYTAEGLKGLQKDKASGRRTAVASAVETLGGKLEATYYCFGEDDVLVIVDLPDNVIQVMTWILRHAVLCVWKLAE